MAITDAERAIRWSEVVPKWNDVLRNRFSGHEDGYDVTKMFREGLEQSLWPSDVNELLGDEG